MSERYVVLGLARARSQWFSTVSRWATSAVLPAEFIRCVSAEELRARLRSGRAFSAALVASDVRGLDRDLAAEAADAGCALLVVDEAHDRRDWRSIGVAAVLSVPFSRDELVEVLAAHASPVGAARLVEEPVEDEPAEQDRGVLVTVTGPGGTGASTVAIALAQGLSRGHHLEPRRRGRRAGDVRAPTVLLADLCRCADQAMLHDARAVVPGLQELVEAHRSASPWAEQVRRQTFEVPARGYRLLLGLRRHRHWVSLRPRAFEATLDSLQRVADVTVADVEADVEGEAETGSHDVEERNLMARAAIARAAAVVVVGAPSMKGLYAVVRILGELVEHGVPVERLVPVIARAPRSPRARGGITRALGDLLEASIGREARRLADPVHLPERRLDEALRDGVELPGPLPTLAARAVADTIDRCGDRRPAADEPLPVAPGRMVAFGAGDEVGP